MDEPERARHFEATVVIGPTRRVLIPLPFNPDKEWGVKTAHHVAGSVNGMRVRAALETLHDGSAIVLGPAWRRDCGIKPGDLVAVVLAPEGPQRDELSPDLRAALEAEPAAAAFFDGLAQFYRNAYLRWIDATKRHPDKRAARIADTVALCALGQKQRADVGVVGFREQPNTSTSCGPVGHPGSPLSST